MAASTDNQANIKTLKKVTNDRFDELSAYLTWGRSIWKLSYWLQNKVL